MENKIELRSHKAQNIIGKMPKHLLVIGAIIYTIVLIIISVIMLVIVTKA